MDASKTQSKHFPGPWQLCYDGQIDATDGRIVACFGWDTYREFTELPGDEQKTLRLIAAAPDLLAALQEAQITTRELCEGQGPENECWAILNRISAAIAKATGAA